MARRILFKIAFYLYYHTNKRGWPGQRFALWLFKRAVRMYIKKQLPVEDRYVEEGRDVVLREPFMDYRYNGRDEFVERPLRID